MNKIITISREFGSGGRLVGRNVAEKLGIPFYDKEIILKAAEISGLDARFIEEMEQKLNTTLMFNFTSRVSGTAEGHHPTLEDRVFFAECKVIKEFADRGPCVIVGRAADFILEGENCEIMKVFVRAPFAQRVERLKKYYEIQTDNYEGLIKKTDKLRSRHYEFYTDRKWGRAENYDLSVNTGLFGVEGASAVIIEAGKRFLGIE